MTYQQELKSWLAPSPVPTSSPPSIGSHAPSIPTVPTSGPLVITFLRHCGCPFAEKAFLNLRSHASSHPDITFIAVSHGDQVSTDKWLAAVGGAGRVQVIVDPERRVYGAWGLGISSFWHVLNPQGLWNVYKLGKEEGIWNRPTESGSRWQTGGTFAVDGTGIVRWGQAAPGADWIPDFEEAVKSIEG
ncbi:MAG: hypothetical protein HETSPECPRED_005716 [Heterodermia speciosa]|uniref:Alkyl hydroperoxide reductase subunit C/ Thiol specific antioxidant domain-containing protein n=1 Tax=Heterodermia speciosa TaxID=116794 RepID=A0A8H3ISX2_9LECA|nr:MAG: hypothetical protein HETSPECPRED_005716 [Heterodermia speciosa]